MRPLALLAITALLPFAFLRAQTPRQARSGYDNAARATLLHTANVYVSADADTPPIITVTPGHEIVISARNGPWVNIFANTDTKDDVDPDSKPEFENPDANPDPSSGWIRDKGVVSPTTPSGDVLLFGSAADFESQAAEPHGPKNAAEAAHLLYRRFMNTSPTHPWLPKPRSAPPTSAGSSTNSTSAPCPARMSRKPFCGRSSLKAS